MPHERRDDNWIQTATGRAFWPFDPRPEDIDVRDIAHALSNDCRFTGHCREFYSVAEHSVRVSMLLGQQELPREVQFWGLLHDASEAYLRDLARPIKHLPDLAPYRMAEEAVQRAICARFGLPAEEPPEVKAADKVLLATELRDLMGETPRPWLALPPPLPDEIHPLGPVDARCAFLQRFRLLTRHTPEVR